MELELAVRPGRVVLWTFGQRPGRRSEKSWDLHCPNAKFGYDYEGEEKMRSQYIPCDFEKSFFIVLSSITIQQHIRLVLREINVRYPDMNKPQFGALMVVKAKQCKNLSIAAA
jgi:hypothetical protein